MKEKLTELTEKLEQGVSEIFTSENYTNWLRTMSRFHHYSIGNTILIALQAPYASQVASFSTWKKLHRHVRKGEKGIKILVPAPVKVKEEKQKFDPDTAQPLIDTNGNPLTEILSSITRSGMYLPMNKLKANRSHSSGRMNLQAMRRILKS